MKKLIIIMLLFSSCKKENGGNNLPDNTVVNNAALIGTWEITSIISDKPYDYNGDGILETDVYAAKNDCQKVFILQFNADNSGEVKTDCNSSFKGTVWKLTDNGNTVLYHWGNYSDVVEHIVSVNDINLVTTTSLQPPSMVFYTLTKTYHKQ